MQPILNRRDFIKTAGLGTASLAMSMGMSCAQLKSGRSPGKKRPNFVFILIDDMGWMDLGCMGSQYYETPNIDRLAREGMTFTSAYANAPNCAPTRASLLSGQYTPRHGIYTVGSPERGKTQFRKLIPIKNKTTLDSKVVILAEALKASGYVCGSIGKWHLGDDPELGPLGQGFDHNIGGGRFGHPPAGYNSPYKLPNLEEAPVGEYLTDRLTDEALAFIEMKKDNPFFLYLPHYAVHTPIQAKKEITAKYRDKDAWEGQNNANYAAMIESTDQGVGRILGKLDELDLARNTVVFFFSDNGGHGTITSMKPLRGSKGMLYEGGIREPMIVRWPGRVQAGTTSDVPVIGIDFYPTILELAGARKPDGHVLDGESLAPLMLGEGTPERDALYWHFPAYLEAYKGMKGHWRTTPAGAIRQGDWKLLEFFEDGRLELYNLKQDIGEQHDQAAKRPDMLKKLHQRLLSWRKSINAPVPVEKNPQYDPDFEPVKKKKGEKGKE